MRRDKDHDTGGRTPRFDRGLATIALMIATGMQTADATIVNVALPRLEGDLGGGVALGAWVMTSYLCATAVMAPLSGWLRWRWGARRLFAGAITLFVVASLGCALTPSAAVLILFRIAQGAGGGVLLPMAQAILLDLYPEDQHGRMLGIWGAAAMVGPIMGPVLGGIITDMASWRYAFAINLPLGILALWGTRRILEPAEAADDRPFDGIGILLMVAGIAALQLFLARGGGSSWLNSPELLVEAAVAGSCVIGLAVRARRSGLTIIRPDVLNDLNFAVAGFYNFMASALLFTALVFIPAMIEGPFGYSATISGLTILPRALLMMLVMLLVGRLVGRIDYRILLGSGWVLMAFGLLLLWDIRPPHELFRIVTGSTIQAGGAGMLFTPLNALAYSTIARDRRTDAAGMYSLLRQLGCASGVALMTAVLRSRVDAHLLEIAAEIPGAGVSSALQRIDAANLRAYADCFGMMALAALVLIPGILLLRGGRLGAERVEPA